MSLSTNKNDRRSKQRRERKPTNSTEVRKIHHATYISSLTGKGKSKVRDRWTSLKMERSFGRTETDENKQLDKMK